MPSKAARRLAQKRLDAFTMRRRRRIEAAQGQALANEMARYFRGMRGRLKLPAAAKSYKFDPIQLKVLELKESSSFPSADELLDWQAEDARVRKVVHKAYVNIASDVYQGVGEAVGLELSFGTAPEFDNKVLSEIGQSVKGIGEVSRGAVQRIVTDGLNGGLSPDQIARNLIDQFSGWGGGPNGTTVAHSRAKVIARTETAIAYNRSAIAGYEKLGLITKVKVLDAPDCGWTSHADPDLANGRIVDLEAANRHPVAHPNCVRAFSPVVDSGEGVPELTKPGELVREGSLNAGGTGLDPDAYADPFVYDYTGNWDYDRARNEAWAQGARWGHANDLTAAEQRAAATYQGSSYADLNDRLRTGEKLNARQTQLAEGLDSAIARNQLDEAIILRRGTTLQQFGIPESYQRAGYGGDVLKKMTGQTVTDEGFLSTASGQGFSRGVDMVITAPKGSNALWMSNKNTGASYGKLTDNAESEVLFGRGRQFRIDRVEAQSEMHPTEYGFPGAAWRVFVTLLK